VTITVKRGGVPIASKTTSVWAEGGSNVYAADFFVDTQTDAISPGDEVEVATSELATAVTVAGVGEMVVGNPGSVDGTAPPLNTVWIMVSQKVPNTCSTYDIPPAQMISSTAAGTYTASFNWLWRGARISLSVTDSEGSGTTTYPSDVYVPVINVTKYNNAVDGFVKPLQVVTITLLDVASSTLKTVIKTADKDGYFFDYTFLKGTANGHAIRVTTVEGPREVLIDGLTEAIEDYQVSGNGPDPNVPVVVKVVNSHGVEKGCKVVTTDSTPPYTYTADFSGDPGAPSGGDNVYVSHANADGDFLELEVGVQNRHVYLPLIRKNQ
jgi:hypothetical protein